MRYSALVEALPFTRKRQCLQVSGGWSDDGPDGPRLGNESVIRAFKMPR